MFGVRLPADNNHVTLDIAHCPSDVTCDQVSRAKRLPLFHTAVNIADLLNNSHFLLDIISIDNTILRTLSFLPFVAFNILAITSQTTAPL
jgi:hypothetical protein